MKICNLCKESKEKHRFEGTQGKCRDCRNRIARENYDPAKEKVRQVNKKEKHGDRIKEQNKIACIRYRAKNLGDIRERGRARYHRKKLEGFTVNSQDPKNLLASVRKWQKSNKHKVDASYQVRKAIRKGELVKRDHCQACGTTKEKLEAHHHDYSKPLDVIWCCRKCHCKYDRMRRKEEELIPIIRHK